MRAPLLIAMFAVTACDNTADKETLAAVEAAQQHNAAAGDAIPCAGPNQPMRRDCVVERTDGGAEGLILTLRHPDGAFRRLLVTKDGRGVVAADGAEPATFKVVAPDQIEVTIADERYQLPATVKGGGSAR